jgi:DNA-binding HxlR family transcriptional regulator
METKKEVRSRRLPLYEQGCGFEGYDPSTLMAETAKLRNLITKRGTLEILIPLCCSTKPTRHKKFKETLKGVSSKTLAYRLQELEKSGILERRAYNEIPPRVEYRLTVKGQELVESVIDLLQWISGQLQPRRMIRESRSRFTQWLSVCQCHSFNWQAAER